MSGVAIGEPIMLRHARLHLALHRLREGVGGTLLLLHGLGEQSPAELHPVVAASWPGSVYALDFAGHGRSGTSEAGGYTCEFLLADVDIALAHLGPCTLLGRGLGGYIAVLAAGARPDLVRGAIVADGPGLSGGGQRPIGTRIHAPEYRASVRTPDPYVFLELGADVRPSDYVSAFVQLAVRESGLDQPVTVAAISRPPWITAILSDYGVGKATLGEALRDYANLVDAVDAADVAEVANSVGRADPV